MNTCIPEDFPFAPTPGAVGGAQLKFSVVLDQDGRLREPGSTMAERELEFARCCEVVDWGIELLRSKAMKPKYAGIPRKTMLAKFNVNLEDDFEMPAVYRHWILQRVAHQLGWTEIV